MTRLSAFLTTTMLIVLAVPTVALADQKKASPNIYQNAAKGAHIPPVTLETRRVPTGGSTGPTVPPKPTQGNTHR
jgi:hypothetical protein